MHERDDYVFRALRAGAPATYSRDLTRGISSPPVRAVNRGDIHVDRPLTSTMVRDYLHRASAGEGAGPDALSDRETEVVRTRRSRTDQYQIAQKLNISRQTVQSHRPHHDQAGPALNVEPPGTRSEPGWWISVRGLGPIGEGGHSPYRINRP